MSTRGWLRPNASDTERTRFGSLGVCQKITGETINDSRISRLERVTVAGRRYYVKVYRHSGRNLRRFVGRSRAQAECENARFFEKNGVPTARVVAWHEERSLGRNAAAVVTEEVPGTYDLAHALEAGIAPLDDPCWVDHVSARLADHVRRLHDLGFIHHDLKFRNVLVGMGTDLSAKPEVYIIDCPLGRRTPWPFRRRGIVKDLACLDRMARDYLSRSRRLRFFMRYHRLSSLDTIHRRQIEMIGRFFEGR